MAWHAIMRDEQIRQDEAWQSVIEFVTLTLKDQIRVMSGITWLD